MVTMVLTLSHNGILSSAICSSDNVQSVTPHYQIRLLEDWKILMTQWALDHRMTS